MIYDGILSFLLDVELDEMKKALHKQLGKKPKAYQLNVGALDAGYAWAQANLTRKHSFRVERMNETAGKILIEGNAAAAVGCLMAGVTVVAWYPITPSSSLCETLIEYLRRYRMDKETGKASFAVVQAEDEIAALGMVVGATWAGARAMTSTSGPGISLMAEFTGLAYYAEIPAVIFDIQRVGPSTGLPTRTAQQDVAFAAGLSHGDARHILLLPSSVDECYTMAMQAFDLSERFQTPVFVMSELDLAMNNWMSHPFPYPEGDIDRGKVLSPEKLKELGEWGRYKDVDGDGIPYRTLPGSGMPAYFTRGSGHNEKGQYSERPDDFVNNLDRLARKFDTARTAVPAPVVDAPGAKVGIIAYGTSHWAIIESRDQLRKEAGPRDVVSPAARVPVQRGSRQVHRHLRSRLRRRTEPRRADARPDAPGAERRSNRQAAQGAALQRPADRRASITDDILAKEGHALVKHEFGDAHEDSMGGVGGE